MKLEEIQRKKIPPTPGVYFFLSKEGEILYIGRATSLRDRVASYFAKDVIAARGAQIVQMVEQAARLNYEETDSVLEAVVLEANLIKKHEPRFNTRDKDNKSFNYVVITNEDFPQVTTLRGRELVQAYARGEKFKAVYGPFPQGAVFKEAVKIIRKIFPWRDAKCTVGQGKACFNRQLGLCPGTCTGEVTKAEYQRLIRHIRLFFEGKKGALLAALERDMKAYAKAEHFEKAASIRKQIFALQHIQDVSLLKRELREPEAGRTMRIEAYDVAHIAGTSTVGVMTVLEGGERQPREYRKFRIRNDKTGSDTDALREMLHRRLGRTEWPLPRLIVVDGGKAQKNAAELVLREVGVGIPVVAVTKDEHHRPREIQGEARLRKEYENDILLANSEAHRFAVAYHRKLRSK